MFSDGRCYPRRQAVASLLLPKVKGLWFQLISESLFYSGGTTCLTLLV